MFFGYRSGKYEPSRKVLAKLTQAEEAGNKTESWSFAANLKRLMAKQGVTQVALAQAAEVSQGSVSGWLTKSMPRADKLNAIAQCLRVTVSELLNKAESPPPGLTEDWKAMREQAGLTLEEVAQRVPYAISTINGLEKHGEGSTRLKAALRTLYTTA